MTEVAVGNQGSSYIPEGSVAKVGRKERTNGVPGARSSNVASDRRTNGDEDDARGV
jgi:hypothetical protein